MVTQLKKIVFALTLALGIVAFNSSPLMAQAQPAPVAPSSSIADNICKGVLSADSGTVSPNTTVSNCQETGNSSFSFIVRRIINIFTIIVGAVSVIMIIIGGFRYIISGGDSSGVSGAKNTILYAVVGLVIVLFAQVIIRFVLTNASPGVN